MIDRDEKTLRRIVQYIEEVSLFISGYDYDAFHQDKKTVSACSFGVMQIGELAKELSDDIQQQNPTIPWNGMRGMRNRIAHDYDNIDSMVLGKRST